MSLLLHVLGTFTSIIDKCFQLSIEGLCVVKIGLATTAFAVHSLAALCVTVNTVVLGLVAKTAGLDNSRDGHLGQ